ncbi:MAG TPA: septal ring lytic transglycosylase RlpA family protein [Steroidobacteraceae bacterium]|nr:septal ring lytic transglycosylase RlpA family protein [Steroidobacteraceae bacterium]
MVDKSLSQPNSQAAAGAHITSYGRLFVSLVCGAALVGCMSQPPREPSSPAPTIPDTVPTHIPPPDIGGIPDAVPQAVVRSRLGNPAFYEVFGKRYFVLPTSEGFIERGRASWYGPGFHKERTATGDPYDMYSMTAAHKTLPLPCYARVTNLSNGRSVIVYINDRGPFKEGRIVDLSYTAAAKLDMLKAGTAAVELQVISIGSQIAAKASMFVQAGAFGTEANALRLADTLRNSGYPQTAVRSERQNSRILYRVRIGPVANAEEYDRVVARLKSLGIADARLTDD